MRKSWLIFIFFLVITFIFRFSSFFQSLLDPDESLYLLVARSILEGHPPYIEVWDHKPPGIFVLFALALKVFGNSVISIRLLACLAVAATCYLLYLLGKLIFKENGNKVGVLAGVLYATFSLANTGLASNAEIFFIPFATLSLYILLSSIELEKLDSNKLIKIKNVRFFAIGLLMGIAAQIKYLVVFDFIAILMILARNIFFSNRNWYPSSKRIIKYYIWLSLGSALIFLLTSLYFFFIGYFDEYLNANILAQRGYIGKTEFSTLSFISAMLVQLIRYFALWVCLLLTLIYLVFGKIAPEEKSKLFDIIIWLICVIPAALLSKRYFDHYFIQWLPPLCLIGSYVITKLILSPGELGKLKRNLILIPIVSGLLLSSTFIFKSVKMSGDYVFYRYIKGINNWGDESSIIAEYLKKHINKNDYIYVHNYAPIIYFLAQAKTPTKYVFPGHLTANFTHLNSRKEFANILKRKPVYIIRSPRELDQNLYSSSGFNIYVRISSYLSKYIKDNSNTNTELNDDKVMSIERELDQYLDKYYVFDTSIKGVNLYKRKN